MRNVFLVAVIALSVLFAACGGGSDSNGGGTPGVPQLTSGNWALHATSQVVTTNGPLYIGGNINHSGSSITGVMHILNSSCFDMSTNINFSGTSNGNTVNLTSAMVNSQVVTITGTISGSNSLSGTYSIVGGCAAGDHGALSGNFVPSISGTWKATEAIGSQTLTTTTNITQQSTPDQWGTYPLSGSIAFSGATGCFTGGTIDVSESFIAGDVVAVYGNMTTAGGSGQLLFIGLLNNPASPTQIVGAYSAQSSSCSSDVKDLTFTKQ